MQKGCRRRQPFIGSFCAKSPVVFAGIGRSGAFHFQVSKKLVHIVMLQDAQSRVIEGAVIVYQVVAEAPHFFHHNAAFGQSGVFPFGVHNDIGMVNAIVVKGGNNLMHSALPLAAVHDADDFRNGYAC